MVIASSLRSVAPNGAVVRARIVARRAAPRLTAWLAGIFAHRRDANVLRGGGEGAPLEANGLQRRLAVIECFVEVIRVGVVCVQRGEAEVVLEIREDAGKRRRMDIGMTGSRIWADDDEWKP